MSDKEFEYDPCVGSGMCCKKTPCPYGKWNESHTGCDYLVETSNNVYRCGNYDYIVKQPGNEWIPAFGAGCCMNMFNTARNNIIGNILKDNIDPSILDEDIQNYFKRKYK